MQFEYKNYMPSPATKDILALAESREIVRPRDFPTIANPGQILRRLVDGGVMLKVGRGLYTLADRKPSGSFSLSQAAARAPGGIVCLLSALEFHDIGTQMGYRVWLAVGNKGPVKIDDVPVRIVRMSGKSFDSGIETHEIGGIPIQIYSASKTIADCFKFRRLVGIDVALEALREGWRERKFEVDELIEFARIDRVEKLIRPYLEMVLA